MMSVELKRTAEILKKAGKNNVADQLSTWAGTISKGVWEHGVVTHKKYGRVFAFEVDGYGSSILMDDANLPSLLALPLLGFIDADDKVYKNTRKMILEKQGNPYFLTGTGFGGIGGPHIGLQHAWPMSVLVQAMTSDDDEEILRCVESVKNVSRNGLIHESIRVDNSRDYTSKFPLPLLFWYQSNNAQGVGSHGRIPYSHKPFSIWRSENLISCLERVQSHIPWTKCANYRYAKLVPVRVTGLLLAASDGVAARDVSCESCYPRTTTLLAASHWVD